MALLGRGLDYAINQLSFGVDLFREIIDTTSSQKLLEDLEFALSSENVEECNTDDEEDADDEDEIDENESLLTSYNSITDTGNSTILNEINAEVLDNQCLVWKLPFDINQGSVGGRNGSSACSIIALVTGHLVHAMNIPDPEIGPLTEDWLSLLVRSMELGNKVYDDFRENLPSRYLSTAEACDILSGIISLIPDSPLPVRLIDSHRPSTVAAQLQMLLDDEANQFAVLTISDKSSVFILRPSSILFVDSHCHVPNGAVVLKGNRKYIDEFCQSVWTVGKFNPEVYGNLVALREA